MYKKIFISLCVFIPLFTQLVNAQDNDPNMGIIPAPVSVKKAAGQFVLSQQTILMADSVNNKAVVFFVDYLQNKAMLKVKIRPNNGTNPANSIVLNSKGADNLPVGGYNLTITPQQIVITGKGAGNAFRQGRGCQTPVCTN